MGPFFKVWNTGNLPLKCAITMKLKLLNAMRNAILLYISEKAYKISKRGITLEQIIRLFLERSFTLRWFSHPPVTKISSYSGWYFKANTLMAHPAVCISVGFCFSLYPSYVWTSCKTMTKTLSIWRCYVKHGKKSEQPLTITKNSRLSQLPVLFWSYKFLCSGPFHQWQSSGHQNQNPGNLFHFLSLWWENENRL